MGLLWQVSLSKVTMDVGICGILFSETVVISQRRATAEAGISPTAYLSNIVRSVELNSVAPLLKLHRCVNSDVLLN